MFGELLPDRLSGKEEYFGHARRTIKQARMYEVLPAIEMPDSHTYQNVSEVSIPEPWYKADNLESKIADIAS